MKGLLESLKKILGEKILALILNQLLTKENILKALDSILDFAEDLALKTDTPIDDAAILKIREALGIPDNDQPTIPTDQGI